MAKRTRASKVDKLSFEEALTRLEQITQQLDSGEVGLEQSIEQFEEAVALHDRCRKILDRAEQRIKKIQFDAAGGVQVSDAPELAGEDRSERASASGDREDGGVSGAEDDALSEGAELDADDDDSADEYGRA